MSSLAELTALVPAHPALLGLLHTQRPFTAPSAHPHADVVRFLTKLSAFVVSKDPSLDGVAQRRRAWNVAAEVVAQDKEGWVITSGWGKSWVNALLGLVSPLLPEGQLADLLELLVGVFRKAGAYPAFSREVVLPVVHKVSQALVAVAVEGEGRGEGGKVALVLDYLPILFPLSPTPHRPLVPTLLPLLHRILLTAPIVPLGKTLGQRAAVVLAHLHILAGKVAASPAFHTDMLLALAESHACLSSLIDGTLLLPPYHAAAVPGFGVTFAQTVDTRTRANIPLGALAREITSDEKIQPFLRALEGWTAVIHAMIAFPTARPVTLPLGGIIHLATRMLTCTPDVPLVEHVHGDPSLAATVRALLPRLWIMGIKLISACTIATGPHVLPHLGQILDQSIHLSEVLAPTQVLTPQLGLLRFHTLLLQRLLPDPSSSAYHTRLAKLCIGYITRLVQQKPAAAVVEDTGKRGKKRPRAGEDAFVGSLSGRVGQGALGADEARVIIASLNLLSVVLPHPALPATTRALAIRLVLSVSYALDCQSAGAVSSELTMHETIVRAVEAVLGRAVKLRHNGSLGPWTGLVLDRSTTTSELAEAVSTVIHPLLPPLSRPLPPVSSLAFYHATGTDGEDTEERRLRGEMGIRTGEERRVEEEEEEGEGERKRKRVDEVVETVTERVVETTTVITPLPERPVHKTTDTAEVTPELVSEPMNAVPTATTDDEPASPLVHEEPSHSGHGHGSLSVQAVPPPVVLPPDPTTAPHEEEDEFEMPEINLESDTEDDE